MDLRFSGGGGFSKKVRKICRPFSPRNFRVRQPKIDISK